MAKDRESEKTTGISSLMEGHAVTQAEGGACLLDRPTDPCTIVILGASGDLTTRKLLPALYSLHLKGGLPDPFRIVGCSRTPMTDEQFRGRMEAAVGEAGHDMTAWGPFRENLHYRAVVYDSPGSYRDLAAWLREVDSASGTPGNRIFYLALPMFLYGTAARLLGDAGLAAENSGGNGWTRIVVEKPYGSDRRSAAELDSVIHGAFQEKQIFRIDHYLAKETVQNILMLRFANAIFEPLWNRNFIEHVDIIASETLGVEKRAGYYDRAGVLRDMFQNHMLQLLALTAMEPPNRFESDSVHDEKVKVFKSLRPFPVKNLFENIVLGQYGPGTVDGEPVRGYRQEEGVDTASMTPTYAMMQVFIDNWRWQGVPFFITSGKRLGAKLTEIAIRFKEVPVSMFRETLGDHISANVLTMGIQPMEHITLTFQAKSPGAKLCLRTVRMDFDFMQGFSGPALAAYEKALLDCMNGDQMLFWRSDGIDLAWAFMEPIIRECETCKDRQSLLRTYEPGSWGPPAAVQLKDLMLQQCR
ncbi:MAG: glucose-6-phosphate dehydrogenase [bacterium]|nr:MAG: glucose-6-phosphate dehydrogenase [bacterium]